MIKALFHYLFPPRRIQDRLPLLPRDWSSEHSRMGQHPDELGFDVRMLKGHGVARTDADAYRLIEKHRRAAHKKIVKEEKRLRRKTPRLLRAWERLKRLWYAKQPLFAFSAAVS